MIACRTLPSASVVTTSSSGGSLSQLCCLFRQFATYYFLSKPLTFSQLQRYRSYYGLSSININIAAPHTDQGLMGWNQKRKMVNNTWRPITTAESSSNADRLSEDMAECENSVSIASGEHVSGKRPELRVVTESNSASTTVQLNTKELLVETTFASGDVQVNQEMMDNDGVLAETSSTSDLQSSAVTEDTGQMPILPAGNHSFSLEVGASLMRFIKGKGGSTQKLIEEEFGVKIIFPASKKGNSVLIQGNSVENIGKASNRIQNVLDEAVKSPNLDYSHFISLPLAIHPELVNKLVRFQNFILGDGDDTKDDFEDIDDDDTSEETSEDEGARKQSGKEPSVAVSLQVQDNNNHVKVDFNNIPITSYQPKASKSPTLSDLGIDRSIFIKPNTFHLTVLMLKLWNQERVDTATKVLRNVSSVVLDALESRPVAVRLKGLECMRGSLSKARVLYVPVEEIGDEGRLLRACQVIIGAFVEAGLVLEKDARQKLKLHATVMNARHRKKKRRAKKNDSFDARGIYERSGSELWGEYGIREAHLSQRFVFDDNGYYHCCAAIPFPQNMSAD